MEKKAIKNPTKKASNTALKRFEELCHVGYPVNALCLMLLPVVHGEKYASDAGLVGSRLRLGVLPG